MKFSPHRTLRSLRGKPDTVLMSRLAEFKYVGFGSFWVSSFTVFQRILLPFGTQHVTLAHVNLH
ncbi:MAG: hypothetical protein LBE38_10925 [Deltaproteobacteria bacterium]|nr:hypothetical protein [Deltaproteobacteria bacterium]